MAFIFWAVVGIASVGATLWARRRARRRNVELVGSGVVDPTAGTLRGSPHYATDLATETAVISAHPPPAV